MLITQVSLPKVEGNFSMRKINWVLRVLVLLIAFRGLSGFLGAFFGDWAWIFGLWGSFMGNCLLITLSSMGWAHWFPPEVFAWPTLGHLLRQVFFGFNGETLFAATLRGTTRTLTQLKLMEFNGISKNSGD